VDFRNGFRFPRRNKRRHSAVFPFLKVTDGEGRITGTNRDDGQPNAPPTAPKASDIVVSNEYDDSGNLVKVTDGESRITGFRYDGFSRKTRTTGTREAELKR